VFANSLWTSYSDNSIAFGGIPLCLRLSSSDNIGRSPQAIKGGLALLSEGEDYY